MPRRLEQEKNRRLVYVGAAVIPTPSPRRLAVFILLLVDLVWAGIRQHDRDQRKPRRNRLGFDQFPPHGVHRHPIERLVERGQEPDDFKIGLLAKDVQAQALSLPELQESKILGLMWVMDASPV